MDKIKKDLDDKDIDSCKVVLIGSPGVGKTCIINSYSQNIFTDNVTMTTGASFSTVTKYITKQDKYIEFEIWDTVGQEKYRSLTRMFYKDSNIAILVYDITHQNTYDDLVQYWVDEIKKYSDDGRSIAANKSDLYEKEEVDEEKGRKLANEIGAIFQTTSARYAVGIDNLFQNLGSMYIDQKKNCLIMNEDKSNYSKKHKKKKRLLSKESNRDKSSICC